MEYPEEIKNYIKNKRTIQILKKRYGIEPVRPKNSKLEIGEIFIIDPNFIPKNNLIVLIETRADLLENLKKLIV